MDKKTIIGVIAGAFIGFMYYRLIGCNTGTCAITSNPYLSTIYGGVMGGLLGSLFTELKAPKTPKAPKS